MQPAIVIPAYNRPHTLARLLASLETASYPSETKIPLIISIDPEGDLANQSVLAVAESFEWSHGPKEIISHPAHLGLLENFYFCGNLTRKFGSIIFLEDDSVVSPVFYYYAAQTLEHFQNDIHIGGISLHRYAYNGYIHYPFMPLADGTDVFFMQVSSIMGQAWSQAQWDKFTNWRSSPSTNTQNSNNALHASWSKFATDDHFPILTKYLTSTSSYYVFPQISLTSGFGDTGTHFKSSTSYFQVPLLYTQTVFRFPELKESNLIYDSFMEILPECLKRMASVLDEIDFAVDLHATKTLSQLNAPYTLTIRPCQRALKTFALSMKPMEANLIYNSSGADINLCHTSDLLWGKHSTSQIQRKLHHYFSNTHQTGVKNTLMNFLLELTKRFTS